MAVIGLPDIIEPLGKGLFYIAIVFLIFPSIPLLVIEYLGGPFPPIEHQIFVLQNLWLWLYFIIFYACVFYFIIPKLSAFKSFLFNRIKRNKNIYE